MARPERCPLNFAYQSLLHGVGEVEIGSRREMHRTCIGGACFIATKCLRAGGLGLEFFGSILNTLEHINQRIRAHAIGRDEACVEKHGQRGWC